MSTHETPPTETPLIVGEVTTQTEGLSPESVAPENAGNPSEHPSTPWPASEQLGVRGSLKVTSENRGLVRKWLTAQGIPFSIAGHLPNGGLQTAYNDTTDNALNAIKAQAKQAGGKPASEPSQQGEGAEGTEGEGKQEQAQPLTEAQKAVQTLAESLGLKVGGADEKTIRRIAREEAAKAKGREKRITIVTPLGVRELGERTLHPLFERVCKAVSVGVAPLVFGPAGSGKTTLAEQVSEALDLPFYFSGAVLKKHELLGYTDANGRIVRTQFREAFEHGGLFLFDEVDASSPAALLCVNAALANAKCDFPDGTVKAHKDFRFIAAANTNGQGATREYCGRNQLDAATLDRFVTFNCEYDPALTARLIGAFDLAPEVLAKALEWDKRVLDYRKALTEANVRGVISPRASLNGTKLLSAGFTYDELEESLVALKFGNAEERKRLLAKGRELTAARHAKEAQTAAQSQTTAPAAA